MADPNPDNPHIKIKTMARMNKKAHTIVTPVWLRQDFESDEEWGLFELYRSLKAIERSVKTMFKQYPETQPYDLEKLEKWFFWKERAAEYDRYLDREAVGAVVVDRTVQAVRREQLSTIENMHKLLSTEIKQWMKKQQRIIEQGGDVTLFTPHEMIRALREVVLLGRLIMGESTENVNLNVPLDKLTDQELAFLTDIQRKFMGPVMLTEGTEIPDVKK